MEERRLLTREDFLAAKPRLQIEKVHVPEMGGDTNVREMDNDEHDDWEAAENARANEAGKAAEGDDFDTAAATRARMKGFAKRLAARTLCQPDGTLHFKPEEWESIKLGKRSMARIFAVARRLNLVTEKDVEELLGNSGGGRGAASGTT